jgi:hypothetical protein
VATTTPDTDQPSPARRAAVRLGFYVTAACLAALGAAVVPASADAAESGASCPMGGIAVDRYPTRGGDCEEDDTYPAGSDTYGRGGSDDAYGRGGSDDAYARGGSDDAYPVGSDTYGRGGSDDAYARGGPDAYARGGSDAYAPGAVGIDKMLNLGGSNLGLDGIVGGLNGTPLLSGLGLSQVQGGNAPNRTPLGGLGNLGDTLGLPVAGLGA